MSLNDKNLVRPISEALAIEAEDAKEVGALGFMPRILVQATMPHKKTAEAVFHRQNGDSISPENWPSPRFYSVPHARPANH